MIDAEVQVRPAAKEDLGAINDIYNHYATESHVTFDTEPVDMKARREWFSHYSKSGPYRLFVAAEGEQLLGFASSSPFKARAGYVTSVETSIYVAPDAIGRGVGKKLYKRLFEAIEGQDLHRAYAGIALPNPASIGLHESFGFKRVALFTEPGRKFGKFWDVAWYEKPLGEGEVL